MIRPRPARSRPDATCRWLGSSVDGDACRADLVAEPLACRDPPAASAGCSPDRSSRRWRRRWPTRSPGPSRRSWPSPARRRRTRRRWPSGGKPRPQSGIDPIAGRRPRFAASSSRRHDLVRLRLGRGRSATRGEILTAFHVVRGASAAHVRAADRQAFEAEIIAADPRSDLAVIVPARVPGVPAAEAQAAGHWATPASSARGRS